MRVAVVGTELPGRQFCDADGSVRPDVHVALQVGKEPHGLFPGDAPSARWELDVRTASAASSGGGGFCSPSRASASLVK